MRVVPLANVPNQSFTVTLDSVRWGIRLRDIGGVTAADVDLQGERLVSGTRALPGEPLVPYRYLTPDAGAFIFITLSDNALPVYAEFGVSQFLVYMSATELAALPVPTVGELTEGQDVASYLTTDDGFYLTTDDGDLLTDD